MSAYKVLSFNENTGQLIIEFAQGLAPLSVDVPIENGLYITGEELDTYVKGFIPTWHLERQSQINSGVANANTLKALVEQTAAVEVPTTLTPEQQQAEANAKMWAELEFEKSVAKALVKFGVLEADPTVIPVQQL
jgi:hypothetical protein